MNPQPGDVLEYPPSNLLLVIVRRYPVAETGEEVEVLWLVGHTHAQTSVHRAHPDTWDGWRKL